MTSSLINATLSGAETVDDGDPIPFDTVATTDGTIALAAGVFTFSQAGIYLVNWWVATGGAGPSTFVTTSLSVNGTTVSSSSTMLPLTQQTGTALISVSAGDTLELINETGETMFIDPVTPQAAITILRVADL